MTTGGPASKNKIRPGDRESLVALARRGDLPARVRGLLDGLFGFTCNWFEPAIVRTLDEVEQALFKLAERSGNSAEQHQRFEALREIKHARADVGPRFLAHAESTLAILRLPGKKDTLAATQATALHTPLELVDSSVLEEDLALREVAGKAEIRNSLALHALSHRLAVIAGTPVWSSEAMPLGPASLAAAFRHALQDIELSIESRTLVYRIFDRSAMLNVGQYYDKLNAWLTAQRILPNLMPPTFQRGEHAGAVPPTPEIAPPTQGDMPAAPTSPGGAAYNTDAELFGTLRHLLGARREATRDSDAPQGPVHHASRDDLQSVLGALQRAPASGARSVQYDSEHFKNTLQVKLRRASPEGRPLSLADEDLDTVDLIGMLFDYVTRNVHESSGARALLTRLHVPVLRVALGDKTFFTRRDHPARELLNTIAETGAHWLDDAESDSSLVDKMQMVVGHVSSDFDGDVGVFENLLGDLSQHMQLLARRAEVVERRHIDAAKGRDRLEIARETARAAIVRLLQAYPPLPRVRALLERAWTDALALSALRDGANGSEFQRRLAAAGGLARRAASPLSDSAADEMLRREFDAGLRQVGMHEDDVRDVLGNLYAAPAAPGAADREKLQRIDETLSGQPRLGGDAPTVATVPSPAPLNAAEIEMLAQLKRTPFGTWFDFVLNQQGLVARRKLAWFSPVTGHCLFVNQRGARSDDRSLDQLARDMVRGQVRVASNEQGSLIDRAWKAIVGMLRPPAAAEPAVDA
jgi:hypothetical protein